MMETERMENLEENLKDKHRMKKSSILLIRVTKGENTKNGGKRIFKERVAENFPKTDER